MNDSSFCLCNSNEEFVGQTGDANLILVLSAEKKYPCDDQTFIVYEPQLLNLLRYCMWCGTKVTKLREIQNTVSQPIFQLNCEKGKLTMKINVNR